MQPRAEYIGAMDGVDSNGNLIPNALRLYNVFNCPGFSYGTTLAEQTIRNIPNITIIETKEN
ncbi:MAG: hypothetical protein DRJ03_01160 [Chloroflexi bacterium]|nr:MAG: hypothetical protein DRJ03_01160 [Chloroflexota bacterium]